MRASGTSSAWRGKHEGQLLALPAWILLGAVVVVPLGAAVYFSLTDASLASAAAPDFVCLANYVSGVIDADFVRGLLATVAIIVLSFVIQFPIGMAIALALVQPLRAIPVFRGILVLPILMTPVAIGLVWKLIADPDLGMVRWAWSFIDPSERPNVFADPVAATVLIVVVNSWIYLPFVALMLLTGLLGIPGDLAEAAAVDGAGRVRRFFSVTLPLLVPVIAATGAIRIMTDYRMFDLVYIVTKGGPAGSTRTLSMLVYQQSTRFFDIGSACAIAVAMVLIVLPLFAIAARRSI